MTQNVIELEPDWGISFGKSPELEIRFVEVRDSVLYALGITHSSIKIGDIFKVVNQYAAGHLVDEFSAQQVGAVNLRVKTITSFHNVLNRIPANMTVGIEFDGDWASLIEILMENDWSCDCDCCHQWSEEVLDMIKLTLSR